jgi:Leucine-rich repeat (LRR) protein
MQRHLDTSFTISFVSLLALSLGCSNGEVNLGDGTISQNVTQASRCTDSPRLEGEIYVHNQAELEQLSGCEQIEGVRIVPFEGIDLTALASLRVIDGALDIGADPEVYPEDVEEQTAFLAPTRALQEGGWLDSLQGLENLESVQALYLTGVQVTDLSELASLANVEGGLVIRHANGLQNLNGLGAKPPLLWIADSGTLSSLDGLELDVAAGSLILERVPALADIDALQNLTSADTLILSGTGITELPDLSQLVYVSALNIDGNAVLTDLSGLAELQAVGSLSIQANPNLTSLPELSRVSSLDQLIVNGNAALEEIALNFPALQPQTRSFGEREVEVSTSYVQISYNESLRRITSPANFIDLQFLVVYQNASLTDIDLGQLERAQFFMINDNPVLDAVAAPSLASVNTLEVLNNPRLSTAVFDGVATFSRQISGNAE